MRRKENNDGGFMKPGALRTLLVMSLASIALSSPSVTWARSGGHGNSSSSHGAHHSSGRQKAEGVRRDSHGKIQRSAEARHAFKRQHPCPSTGRTSGACPGYVIDHVVPLKRGGPDAAYNMQWQTIAAAKAKDHYE